MTKNEIEQVVGLLTIIEMCAVKESDRQKIEYAIDCVEKQIPKKVTIYDGVEYCPNCNGVNIKYYSQNGKNDIELDYCADCGQAIDWRDE